MSLVRQIRGGRDNDPQFGSRMRGQGEFADLIARRFAIACRRLGLERTSTPLDTTRFRPPARERTASAAASGQLDLFGDTST
jgi:hypothetical protein